jgi:glycosyltransferase involved in cell wall biosynthesis
LVSDPRVFNTDRHSVAGAAPIAPAQTEFVATPTRRFDRVAISCVFGDPSKSRTWSGAPNNVAQALQRLGVEVETIAPRIGRGEKLGLAGRYVLGLNGLPRSTEQLLRGRAARRRLADQVAQAARRLGVRDVLHMGTLDLPPASGEPALNHYIYCDQTWDLSLRYRPDVDAYSSRMRREFDELERAAFNSATHVFTFGTYVRDNLVSHYGVASEQVTVVGSGMGGIAPYAGPKDYDKPRLLFVAKHLFRAKGGVLLLDAYRIARERRPDLTLTIVGDERSRSFLPDDPSITLRAHLPWDELQVLYRTATLMVQPMLNDPWGQVYLEALLSRTPVLGLDRNGLPEILRNGAHGFLVDRAEPEALAEALLDAVADPARLAAMGTAGQQHVLQTYSWDRVGERIAYARY